MDPIRRKWVDLLGCQSTLAKELKGLENSSSSTAETLLTAVSKIEESIPHAPATARVTNKVHRQKP